MTHTSYTLDLHTYRLSNRFIFCQNSSLHQPGREIGILSRDTNVISLKNRLEFSLSNFIVYKLTRQKMFGLVHI